MSYWTIIHGTRVLVSEPLFVDIPRRPRALRWYHRIHRALARVVGGQ